MGITIRKDYIKNIDEPCEILIESDQAGILPNFKLRTRVYTNGIERADLRFPNLGSNYFRFDIAPIIRSSTKYDLINTLSETVVNYAQILVSETYVSGGSSYEQSVTSGDVRYLVNAVQDYNNRSIDDLPYPPSFLVTTSKLYIYQNFKFNLVSALINGDYDDYSLKSRLDSLPLNTWAADSLSSVVWFIHTFPFNPNSSAIDYVNKVFSIWNSTEQRCEIPIEILKPCGRFGRYGLTFLNQYGGYDPFYLVRFGDTNTDTVERSNYTTKRGVQTDLTINPLVYSRGSTNTARTVRKRTKKIVTDFMNDEQMQAFSHVIASPDVWLYDDQLAEENITQGLTPVKVLTNSIERKYREKDGLFFCEIEVELDDEIVRYGR